MLVVVEVQHEVIRRTDTAKRPSICIAAQLQVKGRQPAAAHPRLYLRVAADQKPRCTLGLHGFAVLRSRSQMKRGT